MSLTKRAIHKLTRDRYTVCLTQVLLQRPRQFDVLSAEYIRLSALELVAHEINSATRPGAVAEVGVYRGEFARFINAAFPGRRLYLFDTFAGFEAGQVRRDNAEGFIGQADNFSDTSVETVLARLPHRENAVVRKGIFPATAKGLADEGFCFASIDCDLYEPTLDGLKFFYPRLCSGGYIFVHDYNNDLYRGVRRAVKEYSSEQRIAYVPLPDSAGTAIISKP
ncbi:MAG: TylF/MycF/NovP-related O-methyltransferase [Verrucomicrobiales bacterium]